MAAPTSLTGIAHELYALSLAEFTSARNDRAKLVADRALAAEIRALRKPSSSAWVVNQLVRRRPDELESLLDLGRSLRDAQDDLDPDTLRALGAERRAVVAALAREAADIAVGLGHPVPPAALAELEATLQAAMTDPAAGEAVRTGCLLRTLTVSGFDPVDLTNAVALPEAAPPAAGTGAGEAAAEGDDASASAGGRGRPNREERRERELAEAATRAEEAERWAREAEGRLTGLDQRREKLDEARERLEDDAARVRRELEELGERLEVAHAESRDLNRAREEAARAASKARRSADRARERWEYLR